MDRYLYHHYEFGFIKNLPKGMKNSCKCGCLCSCLSRCMSKTIWLKKGFIHQVPSLSVFCLRKIDMSKLHAFCLSHNIEYSYLIHQ